MYIVPRILRSGAVAALALTAAGASAAPGYYGPMGPGMGMPHGPMPPAPPAMFHPRGYGMPGYGMPGYGMPGYGMPGYGVPGYGKPGYGKARPMMGGHGSPAKGGYGSAPSGGSVAGSESGEVVTDAEGMTLYTYAQDEQGVSNCYDACARSWPPVLAGDLESLGENMSLIERRDGTEQVALEGMPLYRWAGDSEPGDMTGDGVGGVWDVARR